MVPDRLSEWEKQVGLAKEDVMFSETLSIVNTTFLLICFHSRLHHHAGVSSGRIKDGSLHEVGEEVRDTHHLVTTNGDFSVKGLQM